MIYGKSVGIYNQMFLHEWVHGGNHCPFRFWIRRLVINTPSLFLASIFHSIITVKEWHLTSYIICHIYYFLGLPLRLCPSALLQLWSFIKLSRVSMCRNHSSLLFNMFYRVGLSSVLNTSSFVILATQGIFNICLYHHISALRLLHSCFYGICFRSI